LLNDLPPLRVFSPLAVLFLHRPQQTLTAAVAQNSDANVLKKLWKWVVGAFPTVGFSGCKNPVRRTLTVATESDRRGAEAAHPSPTALKRFFSAFRAPFA